jgi:hypothetical protein
MKLSLKLMNCLLMELAKYTIIQVLHLKQIFLLVVLTGSIQMVLFIHMTFTVIFNSFKILVLQMFYHFFKLYLIKIPIQYFLIQILLAARAFSYQVVLLIIHIQSVYMFTSLMILMIILNILFLNN